MSFEVISLRELLTSFDEQAVKEILKKFSCPRNQDVENFFYNHSIHYLNQGLARTFILVDREQLEKGVFEILAYFAIGSKIIDFGSTVSKTRRKKLVKTFHKDYVNCYLIGQIGKNANVVNNEIKLNDILTEIYFRFDGVIDSIGGQLILIECYEEKLVKLYQEHGFEYLQEITDRKGKVLHQLIRKVNDIKIIDTEDQKIYSPNGRHTAKNIGLKPFKLKPRKSGFGSRGDRGLR